MNTPTLGYLLQAEVHLENNHWAIWGMKKSTYIYMWYVKAAYWDHILFSALYWRYHYDKWEKWLERRWVRLGQHKISIKSVKAVQLGKIILLNIKRIWKFADNSTLQGLIKDEDKYLGITIDNELNWQTSSNIIFSKLNWGLLFSAEIELSSCWQAVSPFL